MNEPGRNPNEIDREEILGALIALQGVCQRHRRRWSYQRAMIQRDSVECILGHLETALVGVERYLASEVVTPLEERVVELERKAHEPVETYRADDIDTLLKRADVRMAAVEERTCNRIETVERRIDNLDRSIKHADVSRGWDGERFQAQITALERRFETLAAGLASIAPQRRNPNLDDAERDLMSRPGP